MYADNRYLCRQCTRCICRRKIGEFNLDRMVVTASRLEESNFEANANVNVVTRKDIEEKHYQTVSDALRAVPGVAIQNYSATGANYSADYLYVNGTSHVLVLVDGQRANTNGSVSSVFQPSEVSNMDNIERIEVLKGSLLLFTAVMLSAA